ncbi:MAG: MarR family winged helix-turn-helix transcriptional regulator [Burkholderiaceae bacterium]
MADAGGAAAGREGGREGDLDLGVLNEVLGFHVTLVNIVSLELFDRHVGEPLGVRKAEYSLLLLLLANGPTPARRLAQTLRLSAPQFTMMVDRMQQAKWLRRERNPADRRAQIIVLTRDGEALSRRAASLSRTMEQELAVCLSAAERAMLLELLRKVAAYRIAQPTEVEAG